MREATKCASGFSPPLGFPLAAPSRAPNPRAKSAKFAKRLTQSRKERKGRRGNGYWVLAVCSMAQSLFPLTSSLSPFTFSPHFLPSGLPCEGRRVVAASSRRSISPNDYSIFHRTKNLYFTEQLSRISPNGLTGTPAKVSHNTRKEDGIVVCPISALKP